MRIREARKADGAWFVPDVGDNRQNETDPFRVWITPMTYAEKRQLEVETLGEPLRKQRGESFLARAHRFQDQLFVRHVEKVENYGIRRIDGSVFMPKDGKELMAVLMEQDDGEAETIVSQILDAIRDSSVLEEAAVPKSGSPERSSSPATGSDGVGAAPGARAPTS